MIHLFDVKVKKGEKKVCPKEMTWWSPVEEYCFWFGLWWFSCSFRVSISHLPCGPHTSYPCYLKQPSWESVFLQFSVRCICHQSFLDTTPEVIGWLFLMQALVGFYHCDKFGSQELSVMAEWVLRLSLSQANYLQWRFIRAHCSVGPQASECVLPHWSVCVVVC